MRFCALIALALALAATPAFARDPSLTWRTIETPHFRIHFHDGLEPLAQRVAVIAERARRELAPLMRHEVESVVDVVVSDEVDWANGSATVILRPVIELLAAHPDDRSELSDYDVYLWNLFVHEYAHVVHMDQVEGIPRLYSGVFGDLWMPNQMLPSWFKEGVAVYAESVLSDGGRNRSSLYDMFLRAEVLEARFFDIADMTRSPSVWPRGGVPYLHGSRLFEWTLDRYGEDKLPDLTRRYASLVVPFAINFPARQSLGRTWIDLYADWRRSMEALFQDQARAIADRGVTPAKRLTTSGELTGEPRILGDMLYYVDNAPDRRPSLRRLPVSGGRVETVARLLAVGSLTLDPRGRFALVSQIVPFKTYRATSDLFRVDLATGALTQLTHGARVDEPDIEPKGLRVVAVQRTTGGGSRLVQLWIDGGRPLTLYSPPTDCHIFTPRWSPSGERIAFSRQCPGGRDIVELDVRTKALTEITQDRALDLNPTYDPTGRWLVFASDRSGVFNLYARDAETSEIRQITEILDGAFKPVVSPDGKTLVYVSYSTRGYDLSETAFDPASFRSAPESTRPAPDLPPDDTGDTEPLPSRPYRPWRSILPRWWLPVWDQDPEGLALGATTSGADVVGLLDWAATATWGLYSNEPSFDFTARYAGLRPELALSLSSHLFTLTRSRNERQTAAGLTATLPFNWLDQRLSLSFGWRWRYFDPGTIPAPDDPEGPLPRRFDSGQLSAFVLGAAWSNARRYANAISLSEGATLSASATSARSAWGSDFDVDWLEASGTGYVPMPWLSNHVLALHAGFGISAGDLGNRRGYGLGGIGQRNIVYDAWTMTGAFGPTLRGYPIGVMAGDQYMLFNAEYRFPILTIDEGLWTLPFYMRRLYGAAIGDAGVASDAIGFDHLRPSVGGELRTELLIGYGLSTELRLGYVRGLGPGGIHDLFLTLGGSF